MSDNTGNHDGGDTPRNNVVMWGDPDDDLAQLLRSELGREAASITPRDRFAEILEATEQQEQKHSPWRWVVVAAALLLLAGVVAPVLINRPGSQTPAARLSSTQQAVSSPSDNSIQTQQMGLPVYFVNSQTHLFYRESRDLPTLSNPLMTAVNAVLNVAPNNAQYTSRWKGGTVLSAQVKNNVAYVNLSDDAYEVFTNRTDATNAAFQIYYTVNAVLSDNADPITVVLQDDGKNSVPVLGSTTASDFWANPPSLGPVYIASPQSGDKVSAGDVTVTGYILPGNPAPQVTVARADGSNPHTGQAQLVSGGSQQWQKWSCTITFPKGEYQVSVSALDTTNMVQFTVQ